ncbi:hypothetical protein QQF64_023652 [Cirrhinus molitorella]|uniref:Uncharacterized protein n=1 Tax=Cirrhinus molitorella TaxID=172907 RepID=A0ABR3NJ97_9TELE
MQRLFIQAESKWLRFIIRATYDVLPTPVNLQQWRGEDPSCALCSKPASLKHILTGYKVSLTQGLRYTWRHNQVLKNLAATLEHRRTTANAKTPSASNPLSAVTFVREGAGKKSGFVTSEYSQLCTACDWKMLVDVGQHLAFPQEIATTTLRPDMVFWSPSLGKVYIVELTVPWEDSVEEASTIC